MSEFPRARASLEKLLKLARADADAQRIDLADIERAKLTARISLSDLDDSVQREEALVKESGSDHFTTYLSGVRERRINLTTTIATLDQAEETARDKLNAAFVELKKLEHLIAVNERSAKKADNRKDALAADEINSARRRG